MCMFSSSEYSFGLQKEGFLLNNHDQKTVAMQDKASFFHLTMHLHRYSVFRMGIMAIIYIQEMNQIEDPGVSPLRGPIPYQCSGSVGKPVSVAAIKSTGQISLHRINSVI